MAYGKRGIAAYQQAGVQAANYADPYELTAMLFRGALERIAQARFALSQGEVAVKGERIGKALAIVSALDESLDHDSGGELAANLSSLYAYMQRRLLQGNLNNDAAALDEVSELLRSIKDGWDGIPAESRNPAAQGAVRGGGPND